MTCNVFAGTLSLTQSVMVSNMLCVLRRLRKTDSDGTIGSDLE